MIDYASFKIEDFETIKEVLGLLAFYYEGRYAQSVIYKHSYKNFKIDLKQEPSGSRRAGEDYLKISGSFPQYHTYDRGKHNAFDYTLAHFRADVKRLCDELNFSPSKALVTSIEIAVNFLPPESLSAFDIVKNAMAHKRTFMRVPNGSGAYKKAGHYKSRNVIKLYDKFDQCVYAPVENLTRFEVKYNTRQSIESIGGKEKTTTVKTLEDLTKYENALMLRKEVLDEWERIVFYDPTIDKRKLGLRHKEKAIQYSNPNYWWGLLNGIKNDQKKESEYKTAKKTLKTIVNKSSKNIHYKISQVLKYKLNTLLCVDELDVLKGDKKVPPVGIPEQDKKVPPVGIYNADKGLLNTSQIKEYEQLKESILKGSLTSKGVATNDTPYDEKYVMDFNNSRTPNNPKVYQRVKPKHTKSPEPKKGDSQNNLIKAVLSPSNAQNRNKEPELNNNKTCELTGLDISMQRKDSKLLSHTGIKYYMECDPEKLKPILIKYLPRRQMNESIDTQIKELAHNIRNSKYNSIYRVGVKGLIPFPD